MEMKPGEVYVVGNKLMAICAVCEKPIRVDKPIFGSWHFCLTEEEQRAKSYRRQWNLP